MWKSIKAKYALSQVGGGCNPKQKKKSHPNFAILGLGGSDVCAPLKSMTLSGSGAYPGFSTASPGYALDLGQGRIQDF